MNALISEARKQTVYFDSLCEHEVPTSILFNNLLQDAQMRKRQARSEVEDHLQRGKIDSLLCCCRYDSKDLVVFPTGRNLRALALQPLSDCLSAKKTGFLLTDAFSEALNEVKILGNSDVCVCASILTR